MRFTMHLLRLSVWISLTLLAGCAESQAARPAGPAPASAAYDDALSEARRAHQAARRRVVELERQVVKCDARVVKAQLRLDDARARQPRDRVPTPEEVLARADQAAAIVAREVIQLFPKFRRVVHTGMTFVFIGFRGDSIVPRYADPGESSRRLRSVYKLSKCPLSMGLSIVGAVDLWLQDGLSAVLLRKTRWERAYEFARESAAVEEWLRTMPSDDPLLQDRVSPYPAIGVLSRLLFSLERRPASSDEQRLWDEARDVAKAAIPALREREGERERAQQEQFRVADRIEDRLNSFEALRWFWTDFHARRAHDPERSALRARAEAELARVPHRPFERAARAYDEARRAFAAQEAELRAARLASAAARRRVEQLERTTAR